MLTLRQFGVGCHVNIAVRLVRGFHFHRSTWLIAMWCFSLKVLLYISITNEFNMLLVKGSLSKCGKWYKSS